MEQLHFITKLLDIKDPNIQILDIINKDTHKEIIALSFEITFFATIELSDVASKSLLWICL
ncbi:hypothetical protein, partial [Streptococcus pneumoniae]|uniref:hypothetical protein n=1 Tax=Streptococcus pneumoniae TaxID=1313 RepID=UPI00070A801D